MLKKGKTVSLVLGSGGARGLAHIGVIHWLVQQGYEIRSISGCSMGALVGGIYATGKLAEYEKWVRAIRRRDIFTLLDFSIQRGGLFKGDKIIDTLKELVGDVLIEHLPIPFTAVATDVKAEREVWINKGSLFTAIRASISMPLLFTPISFKGTQLIDGGVLNPVPIAPTFGDHTELTIAVNLGGAPEEIELLTNQNLDNVMSPPDSMASVFDSASLQYAVDKISQFVDEVKSSASSYLKANYFSRGDNFGMYDVAYQSFEAMQGTIARQKLASYPPDVLIEIPRNACRSLEFDRAAELIDIGYRATDHVMNQKKPRLLKSARPRN